MKISLRNIWFRLKFCNVSIFIIFQAECVKARKCDYITENEALIKGNFSLEISIWRELNFSLAN